MLESKRLLLCETVLDDIDLYQEMYRCPIITKYLPNEKPYSEEQISEYVSNRVNHWKKGFGTFTILERTTREKIGYVGVETLTDPTKSDIRFGIISSKVGVGFAKEAALKCLSYTFNLGFHDEIYGASVRENIASINTLKSIGMHKASGLNLYDCKGLDYFIVTRKNFDKFA